MKKVLELIGKEDLFSENNPLPEGFKWWRPDHFFSLGFGLGLLPLIPGTWGTLAALPFYYFMYDLPKVYYGIVLFLLIILSIITSDVTAKALGQKDPRCIVCDEVVGWLLVLAFLPVSIMSLLLSFMVFRFFDVLKPWPIGWIDQHCTGGFGIVLDDLLAGVYALLVCEAGLHLYAWLV